MADKEALARIDERTRDIKEQLEKGAERMTSIENRLYSLPCQTQIEKVRTLERVTWGALGTAVSAVVGLIWQVVTKTAMKP